ncbi:MAG: hypothetical protein II974_03620, partial [Firmicutes bacterium]|nr:hypothetical protein [Bacillota bacterium]
YTHCSAKSFRQALARLYENETLMQSLENYVRCGEFPDPAYRKIALRLQKRSIGGIRSDLYLMQQKEKIYQTIRKKK